MTGLPAHVEELLAELRKRPRDARALGRALGKGTSTVRTELMRLERDGLVQRTRESGGTWIWEVAPEAGMTRAEFVRTVAELVAGLQVPASLGSKARFGAAGEPWEKLLCLGNHGFGWTNADELEQAFRAVVGLKPVPPSREPPDAGREPRHDHHASQPCFVTCPHHAWWRRSRLAPTCECPEAGTWGATGIMPAGHIWQWRNEDHTSGYLAHDRESQEETAK